MRNSESESVRKGMRSHGGGTWCKKGCKAARQGVRKGVSARKNRTTCEKECTLRYGKCIQGRKHL